MKQALQLKLGQQLALTPQLQQAIKLLQLSTADLQQTIEETLESNALLERENDLADQDGIDFSETAADEDEGEGLSVDTVWEDVLPSSAPPTSMPSSEAGLRGVLWGVSVLAAERAPAGSHRRPIARAHRRMSSSRDTSSSNAAAASLGRARPTDSSCERT